MYSRAGANCQCRTAVRSPQFGTALSGVVCEKPVAEAVAVAVPVAVAVAVAVAAAVAAAVAVAVAAAVAAG